MQNGGQGSRFVERGELDTPSERTESVDVRAKHATADSPDGYCRMVSAWGVQYGMERKSEIPRDVWRCRQRKHAQSQPHSAQITPPHDVCTSSVDQSPQAHQRHANTEPHLRVRDKTRSRARPAGTRDSLCSPTVKGVFGPRQPRDSARNLIFSDSRRVAGFLVGTFFLSRFKSAVCFCS